MRIIAGEHRGRRIEAPAGEHTRPTTDRVRESLMSSLVSLRGSFEGACVLDAFAGSGALGFEALSRGASSACFCECDSAARACLTRNAETLGYDRNRVRIVAGDVLKRGVPHFECPFDVIFLDPPYALPARDVFDFIVRLEREGRLAADAVIAYEHACATDDDVSACIAPAGLRLCSRRSFRETSLDVLERLCMA